MFTGIIEEIGKVQKIVHAGETLQITIQAHKILCDVQIGDSIAVNGVCLTVTQMNRSSFTAQVMPITFLNTTLKYLSSNAVVNLERSMPANGRFGGHIVTGHVDEVGTLTARQIVQNATVMEITPTPQNLKFCIAKGSIALDGTSLTIVEVKHNAIMISLIPHTQEQSIIGHKKIGDKVNIEFDTLAKLVLQQKQQPQYNPSINKNFLQEHGFL